MCVKERERGKETGNVEYVRQTYKDIGDAAPSVFGALSVGGLDVETEDATGVAAETRYGSHLTAEWVNGEARGILPAKNLVTYLAVYPQIRILSLRIPAKSTPK